MTIPTSGSAVRLAGAAVLWVCLGTPLVAAGPAPRTASSERADWPAVEPGGKLLLQDVAVELAKETLAFDLERFEVFAPDATITLHGEGGRETVLPAPANRYFRGTVAGEPGSRVFLAVEADGAVEGIVQRAGGAFAFIGSDDAPQRAGDGPLVARVVEPLSTATASGGFRCDNAELPDAPGLGAVVRAAALQGSAAPIVALPLDAPLPVKTARVAIETDYELYNLAAFGHDTNKITNYIGNLFGYDSAVVYIPEINTALQVSSISLWTTSSDPWGQSSTTCGLLEFGKYWNANRSGNSRTIAHFLSGRSLGGGIAWLGVLCSSGFPSGMASSCPGLGSESSPYWGGNYGFTANISGSFNVDNPSVLWDIEAVAHEIGHNFSSPHSHCYNGIANDPNPIDQCYGSESGCYSGAVSLPGPSGQGSGTIMSYCHLLSGGMSNLSMTFGTRPGFSYGDQPFREANLINNYVSSVAAASPSCLALAGPAIAAISPAAGLTGGGTAVTITGAGFANGATVSIGSAAATSVVVQNATTITAVTPAHAAGVVSVVVRNPVVGNVANGTAVLPKSFTYAASLPPSVASVSPAGGPLAGGTQVVIRGGNFVSGATAMFAGAAAVPTTFVDASTLQATVPANTAGTKSVTVKNPDTSQGSLANGYFYADPPAAADFYTLPPCRIVDTRPGNAPLAASEARSFEIAGATCGVPANATSVSINVTVVPGGAGGFLALYPGDAFPLGTSALSFAAGVTRANNAVIDLATNGGGTIGVQNVSGAAANVVIDVNGYFR